MVDGIPSELRALRQWVAWKAMPPARKGEKPRKVPTNSRTGRAAKVNDAHTWGTFDEAVDCARRLKLAGIGFVVTKCDPYLGVDLDHCRDPGNGELAPWAKAIVDKLDTYTELSVSGTGVHCILRTKQPPDVGTKRGHVEMYSHGRYFCFTGAALTGARTTIEERSSQLLEVHREVFGGASDRPTAGRSRPARPTTSSSDVADRAELFDRVARYVARVPGALEGERNAAAFGLAGNVAGIVDEHDVGLSEPEIVDALRTWNSRCHPPLDDAELRRCVANALHTGEPRPLKRPRRNASSTAPASADILGPPLTDIGNAERLVHVHGKDLRYCATLGGWLIWAGQRWLADELGGVELRAKDVVRQLRELSLRAGVAGDPKKEEQREILQKFALASESDARIRAALRRARVESGVAVRADAFDAHGCLLNVQNGTIDLRTGELRPHRREDLLTRIANARFDPAARCVPLEQFLDSVTEGDTEFRSYLERAVGCSLAADERPDVLFILFGPSRTGKTTLLEALRSMLGDYAATIPFSALLERERGNAPRPALVDARGARIVVASEAPEGSTFDAATVKAVTGGDTINARRCFENPHQFRPSHVPWLAVNEVPRIRDEPATRVRLRLLPFRHVHEGDPGMRERLREPDAQTALLALAVRGCAAWRRQGLGSCAAVDRAAQQYWGDSSDPKAAVKRFVERCCHRDSVASCATGELFERFVETQGADVLSLTRFGELLGTMGFAKKRTGAGVRRLGLRLLQRQDPGAGSSAHAGNSNQDSTGVHGSKPLVRDEERER